MIFNSPIYPIPPSFLPNEELDVDSTVKYLDYLYECGAQTIMSTAGTSQFNLLNLDEVASFNKNLLHFKGKKIIGLPALSFYHLRKEIEEVYNNFTDIYLLLLFPERYYNNNQLVNFFTQLSEVSINPILVHGNIMRKGYGGNYEYDISLFKELSYIRNFIGIKEESSSLNFATNNIQNLDMEIIVAGGSMRRFWSLEPFGATTYLAGVGSFNPEIEEDFFKFYTSGSLNEAKNLIENFETPLFNIFMTEGWHLSMRSSLYQMGFIKGDRQPFVKGDSTSLASINSALKKIFTNDFVKKFSELSFFNLELLA